jgi:hypothetical protein
LQKRFLRGSRLWMSPRTKSNHHYIHPRAPSPDKRPLLYSNLSQAFTTCEVDSAFQHFTESLFSYTAPSVMRPQTDSG